MTSSDSLAEPASKPGDDGRRSLQVAVIAAVAGLIGACIGVGGTVYVQSRGEAAAQTARAEEALRVACEENLRLQGQVVAHLHQMIDGWGTSGFDSLQKGISEFNELGVNGEALVLAIASPEDGLTSALEDYMTLSDAALRQIVQLYAIPAAVGAPEDTRAARSSVEFVREAAIQVALQCRDQLSWSDEKNRRST